MERPIPGARLRLLRRLRSRARVAAIVGLLPVASPEERAFATTALLSLVEEIENAEGSRRSLETRARTLRDLARLAAGAARSGGADRALDDSVHALMVGWRFLSEPQRVRAGELVRRSALSGRWRRMLSGAPALPSDEDRRSAAEAVGDLVDPTMARPLAVLIVDRDPRVADAAERSLRRLVEFVIGRPLGGRPDPTGDDALDGAVADGARAFREHRRRGVLESAALLLGLRRLSPVGGPDGGWGGPLARWFEDREHESHLVLRSVVRRSNDPRMRARAWEWLGGRGPSVMTAAMDRVGRAPTREDHEAVLARSHLIANPMRARRAGMLAAAAPRSARGGPLPAGAAVTGLSVASRRGLPRFAAALTPDDAALAKALEPLLADSDAPTRFAAARALSPGYTVDYCFDADPRVARHAVLAVSVAGRGAARVESEQPVGRWRALTRSPHAVVRWIAAGEAQRADPWGADSTGSRVAARGAWSADRAGVLGELRARLASGDAAARSGALAVVQRLGIGSELEPELVALATDPGEDEGRGRAAASAATVLGGVNSDSARAALGAALAHAVARVRANAVEAFVRQVRRYGPAAVSRGSPTPPAGSLGPAWSPLIVELKTDRHHRVRANAIRALIDGVVGPPADAAVDPHAELASMLGDDRSMHRVAGLWLAERVLARGGPECPRWNELAARVAGLAKQEPEPAVRVRAERCARRALAAMRTRWRDRVTAEPAGAEAGA